MNNMECPYFGKCGGCKYNDSYDVQLERKKKDLQKLFLDENLEIVPSPKHTRYRNRMDFVYAFEKLGFRQRGSYKIVNDLESCQLINERAEKVFQKIRALIAEYDIDSHDYLEHIGYLKYVTLRIAQNTDQIMVTFITETKDEKIMPVIEGIKDDVESVIWALNPTISDTNFGDFYKSFKQDHIVEELNGIRYKIGPNTFFQNNTDVAEIVFNDIKEHVKGENGLDLYCGVGSITLQVAKAVKNIVGAEIVEDSIRLAKENAEMNGIENVEFHAIDTKDFVKDPKYSNLDFIICDPPRSGMGKKASKRIVRLNPKQIVIMSCNPKTLKIDLPFFQNNYDITFMKAYDMFPNTDHSEMLCVLQKKKTEEDELFEGEDVLI